MKHKLTTSSIGAGEPSQPYIYIYILYNLQPDPHQWRDPHQSSAIDQIGYVSALQEPRVELSGRFPVRDAHPLKEQSEQMGGHAGTRFKGCTASRCKPSHLLHNHIDVKVAYPSLKPG